MKAINVKNITLQFDSSEEVTDEMVNKIIALVNETISEANHFEQPQIIQQDDTNILIIEVEDE